VCIGKRNPRGAFLTEERFDLGDRDGARELAELLLVFLRQAYRHRAAIRVVRPNDAPDPSIRRDGHRIVVAAELLFHPLGEWVDAKLGGDYKRVAQKVGQLDLRVERFSLKLSDERHDGSLSRRRRATTAANGSSCRRRAPALTSLAVCAVPR
jgi:hypothetical protein